MSRNVPLGSLGGGGWGGASRPVPDGSSTVNSKESKRNDKVLSDMYEMFLDSVEAEIIQSVVHSCGFNHRKSMEALLDMCGTKNPSNTTPVQSPQTSMKSTGSGATPSTALQASASTLKNAGNNRGQVLETPRNYSSLGATPRTPLTNSLPVKKPMKVVQPVAKDKMERVRWYIENGKRIMIIMRGCPGSGKSHLAESVILSYGGKPKDHVFSTDDYFMRRNGFVYQPELISEAHQWNQTRVLKKVREGLSPVIVDNTNTQIWEMTVYASMAINYGYLIEILEPNTPWFSKLNELTKRNRHGVPRDKLKIILERYEHGITVDNLIKSTGANYSRLPPQQAENSLVSPIAAAAQNMGSLRTVNPGQRSTVPESSIDTKNFLQNFSPKNMSTLAEQKDFHSTSQVRSNSLNKGFYFGQNASTNSSLNFYTLSKDNSSASSSDPFNNFQKSDAKGSDIFHFKQGSDSILSPHSQSSNISEGLSSEILASHNNISVPAVTSEERIRSNLPSQTSLEDATISVATNSSIIEACTNGEDKPLEKTDEQDKSGINSSEPTNLLSSTAINAPFKDVEAKCSVDLLGSTDKEAQEKSSNILVQSKPLISSVNWFGAADYNFADDKNQPSSVNWFGAADWKFADDKNQPQVTTQQNPLPKPPRSFNMKNVQNYCNSVKDLDVSSQNESGGWSFCEDSLSSWTPIQPDSCSKEVVSTPEKLQDISQRLKFSKCDVEEKETNTHHADFLILSQVSSNGSVDGVVVLNAYDRDINQGKPVSDFKIPVKLKLDKGTLTENDFAVEVKTESKQEKIKELLRLFPNKSTASLKELLKQCNWDVNYISNLLLDETDNDALCTSLTGEGGVESDSDEESTSGEPAEENGRVIETVVENGDDEPAAINDKNMTNAVEEAEEVKRHIESSIDFSERSYSPHLLAIKTFRRGLREGAIPKSSSPVSENPSPIPQGLLEEQNQTTPEQSPTPSEISDGDETKETLEFIVGQDFMQQLADKFGGSCDVGNFSPVVKFPITLARQIHDIIFSASEEQDGDYAMKLQCEEDERLAHRLYEEMMSTQVGQQVDSSPPQLREIMDMELAQAIYKADIDSLSANSQDTAANVLAKRLLEENYSKIDKRTLHDIYASCNFSFEDTVKTLQEALSSDGQVFGQKGTAEREQELINRAQQASVQGRFQGVASADVFNDTNQSRRDNSGCQSVEDSIENDNPWDLSDPKAYYNKYRAKADEYLKERDEMYRKANEAFRRQQRSVAAYYAKLGEMNGKKYNNASAMAAASLAATQADSQSDTLDLHNFKVVEAVIVFDLFIDYRIRLLSDRGLTQESLNIITGKGTHSVNGQPRIRPAIINRAKKRNLRCQQLQNRGVVRVWITFDSKPSHEILD